MKFVELGLAPELLRNIEILGYEQPTPVQEALIPLGLQGRDVYACAKTGTGKTASFLLPIIHQLLSMPRKNRMPRAIIMEPTRELAYQVMQSFEGFTQNLGLKAGVLVGGESIFEQDRFLKKSVDVIIATPGRLLDLHERQKIIFAGIRMVVLDEADRMLDMGFVNDIERMMACVPKLRQTILLSATMPNEIRKLAENYLIFPKEVVIAHPVQSSNDVVESVVFVDSLKKRHALRYLLSHDLKNLNGVVFCNRKKDVDTLYSSLRRDGFRVGALHGDIEQRQRYAVLEGFKNKEFDYLIASDVVARGIDIENLGFVVNFDMPLQNDDYTHRIGRTGRAGAEGVAVTFIMPREKRAWDDLAQKMKSTPKVIEIKEDVFEKKQEHIKQEHAKPVHVRQEHKAQPRTHVHQKEEIIGFGSNIPSFMLR